MRLKIYYKVVILVILTILCSSVPNAAYALTEQKTSSASTTNIYDQSRKRKRNKKKGKKRKRRKRSRRRQSRQLDEALQRAKERVAREKLYGENNLPLKRECPALKVSILPLINRFRDFDREMTAEEIAYLFYNYKPVHQPRELRDKELQMLNRSIKNRGFRQAYAIAQQQLKFTPMDLTLLSKTSQLAHHNGDKIYLNYTWQLTELLYTISKSGNGESEITPYKLHSLLDILRFEELWLETKKKDIIELKILPKDQGNLVKLVYKNDEGKECGRFYQLMPY